VSRSPHRSWGLPALLAAACSGAATSGARAADVIAAAPSDVSVTIYRAPHRAAGAMNLDALAGFALVSETRLVRLPAGESRLRFEGVADGIEAVSAIVTGLPSGVIEKNRDARLLGPAALLQAAVGSPVELERGATRTSHGERLPATILSNAGDGVVFETERGIEALRCSGYPETFHFESVHGLMARPTLSVLVRSARPVIRSVTLSYLSRGFDWGAAYSATLARDGHSMDLGAWVTLANANGVGFGAARTQVVAGRVNHDDGAVLPIDLGQPILATCWPQGRSSDPVETPVFVTARRVATDAVMLRKSVLMSPMAAAIPAPAVTVTQEQLGDLKLYRVPDRTTLASRQVKQVRLMDRYRIPISVLYSADLPPATRDGRVAVHRLLRTSNDALHHLGLPLPSGSVAVYADHLLLSETALRDLAVDEEVELDLGPASDVRIAVTRESRDARAARESWRVVISNARADAVQVELRSGDAILQADHPHVSRHGRPTFRLTVPANGNDVIRYAVRTG
jgi:hypothetical protein